MIVKKRSRLPLFYIFCLASIIILYGGFMFYFSTANPTRAENIIYAAENDILEKVEPSKNESGSLQRVDLNSQVAKQAAVIGEQTDKGAIPQALAKISEKSTENLDRYRCFLEFYIGQSVSFYQQIITILLGVIGVLLVISFMYLRFTSRQQAEDMANEALNSKSFQVILQDMVKKEFAEAQKTDEYAELMQQMPDLANRVDSLEKIITTKADEITEQNS